jgi:hypothetical protein
MSIFFQHSYNDIISLNNILEAWKEFKKGKKSREDVQIFERNFMSNIQPYRRNRGYVLSFKTNRQKLDFWKERYGITDADIRGEQVNDVNDVNVTENIIKQQEIF